MKTKHVAIGQAGSLLVLATALFWKSQADTGVRSEPEPNLPVRISGLSALDLPADAYGRWGAVLAKFHPEPGIEPAALAHYLRLWEGTAGPAAADDTSPSLARRLLDDRTCLNPLLPKQKILLRHARGIRFELNIPASKPGLPPIVAGEAHVGQCLSALAEAGISPDHEVRVGDRIYHVRDLVDDAAWCYSLDEEIEWRTVALALYRPHVAEWPTKYGRKVSWADITDEFLDRWRHRKVAKHACLGTHTLYVLALMTKVDAVHPLWSNDRRAAVDRCLREAAGLLAITQRPDGHWDASWSDPDAPPPASAPMTELLVTGHHLEWLSFRPEGRRPPADAIGSAGRFIVESLSSRTAEEVRKTICPASHGVRAYRLAGIRVR